MPINNITGSQGPQNQRTSEGTAVQVARGEPTANQQETGRPSQADTVSLTDTATRLQGLENTIASLPVEDSQRVEDIARAIENGSFEIDTGRIAEKMLDFESELI